MNIPERHLGKISFEESKELINSTMTLLEVLDPLVDLYEYTCAFITLQDPLKSTVFLLVTSFTILFMEIAVPMWFIGAAVFIQYNAYYQRKFVPHSITYARNANFIKTSTLQVIDARGKYDTFSREAIYWGKP